MTDETNNFSACDMATAAAQGFRDGVASVRPAAAVVMLDQYDAGLLNDFGGGNVEWWQDYMRAELERARDFCQSQVQAPVEQGAIPEGWLFRINPHNPNSVWSFTQDATAAEGYRRAENVQVIRIGGGAVEQSAMVVPDYKRKFECLVEHAKRQDKVIADMRYDENIRRYYDDGSVWFWAGDGSDNLETLACPVVINAGDLRAMLAAPTPEQQAKEKGHE